MPKRATAHSGAVAEDAEQRVSRGPVGYVPAMCAAVPTQFLKAAPRLLAYSHALRANNA